MRKLLLASTMAQAVAMAQPIRARTRDTGTMHTFDARTIDSTGAFLLGELERLDQTLHEPLANITWGRDIDLRSDVSIADEVSSFTNSTFAAAGGPSPTGKSWIGKNTDAIAGIALDIGKTAQPLSLWGMEIGYTIPELESARAIGRPVDSQKYKGMNLKYQMDIDEQVYIGDDTLGVEGLLNSSKVGATNVNKNWKLATPRTWARQTSPVKFMSFGKDSQQTGDPDAKSFVIASSNGYAWETVWEDNNAEIYGNVFSYDDTDGKVYVSLDGTVNYKDRVIIIGASFI